MCIHMEGRNRKGQGVIQGPEKVVSFGTYNI